MSDTQAVRRHLYGWATPNTHRVSILLEELGLDYDVTAVNIRAREQFAPEILALNHFGKVPILVEPRPAKPRSCCSRAARSCCTWPRRMAASCRPGGRHARRRSPG